MSESLFEDERMDKTKMDKTKMWWCLDGKVHPRLFFKDRSRNLCLYADGNNLE